MLYRFLSFFLKTFFHLLYHQFAWTYDWVAAFISLGRWRQWTLSVLPYINDSRILEIGHGPGHLLQALSEIGINTIGLDESQQMIRRAYHRMAAQGFQPLLVHGLAQSLPFSDSQFRQIVSTFPSEYIFHPTTLLEIHRVLTPGGELLVLPVAWITGARWYDRLAASLFRVTGQSPETYSPALIERMISPFQEAGFLVTAEMIEHESSRLLLLHATKPGV